MDCFLRTHMDALALGSFLTEKPTGGPSDLATAAGEGAIAR